MTGAEVVEVLSDRLDGRGSRSDGATVALVIEGGGMRGIVSASMAHAVEQCGLLEVVDIVIGTSSGAVNAAATVSGAIGAFADSYSTVFSSRQFIDPRRALSNRPVVDSPLIVDHLEQLFNLGGFVDGQRGAPRLAVVATDVDAAEACVLTDYTDRQDMLRSIHASGLLPLLGGPPLHHRGRRWLDGGILEPVPVASAARLGVTHAIVLGTRPAGTAPSTGPVDRIVQRHLRGLNPALGTAYAQRASRYLRAMTDIANGESSGVFTLLMTPALGSPLPSRLERSPARLRAAQQAHTTQAFDLLKNVNLVT